ncbi:amidase [Ferruginivarius sediminum]|uniref:Amidase n=1 Tax=Ferruginivarius sediminum TaxID=2661937 RepID=A0A369TEI9_9PROT|nr:amidase [Ferruginivarius sediminum]RDD63759.1 amidase [Ferruginivarius sediminum]
MKFDRYEDFDAVALAGLVNRGEMQPIEILDAAIERIEARDGRVGAIRLEMFDRARERAARLMPEDGPLAGVPYLIKDLGIIIDGTPTTNGMACLKDVSAKGTSTAVTRLEAAGAVVCAKTASSEMGLSYSTEPKSFPPTRNPWNLERTAGGSSGGAAAAVASGMVPAAHASDGGGSIRVPAACCGLFGLKPTRGRVPMGPVIGEGWSGLATQHAITRSVRDSAALLDATAGPETGDPYWAPPPPDSYLSEVGRDPGRLRIALQLDAGPSYPTVPACRAAAEEAARLCQSLGHVVEEAAPMLDETAFAEAFLTIVAAHTADDIASFSMFLGRQIDEGELETQTALLARRGRELTAADYARARNSIQMVGRQLGQFFQTFDVVLTPTLAQPPVPLGHLDTDLPDPQEALRRAGAFSPFTQLANATGCPAANIPLVWSEDGLPLGNMFMAAMGGETLLLRLAAQLEQARPWWNRRPPGF